MTVRLPAIEVLEPRDLFAGWRFTDQEILQMDEPDSAVQVLGVDDFDGDGTIDLMVETNTGVLLLVADKKLEQFRPQELFQAADFAAEMIIDMDQDGDVDVYGSYSTGRHVWFENFGDMKFAQTPLPTYGNDHFVDVDTDGDLDGVALVEHVARVPGRFVWHETVGSELGVGDRHDLPVVVREDPEFEQYAQPPDLVFADFDLDGDIDIVSSPPLAWAYIVWYRNDGVGNFTEHQRIVATSTAYVTTVDLDGDGDLDLLANHDQANLPGRGSWFENKGGKFGAANPIVVDFRIGPSQMRAVEMNDDDRIDVVVLHRPETGKPLLSVYLQSDSSDGQLRFTETFVHRGVDSMRIGDIDNDGDVDILATAANKIVLIDSLESVSQKRTGDLNHDGIVDRKDVDLFAADFGQHGANLLGDANANAWVGFDDFLILFHSQSMT